ncbi:hypothetical protein GCM10022235_85730 [Kribbella ginsengisoli]|uniref:YcaO domain-containing protein n=1 Tax=Kribbella ginsengisoli TaxID=363865 RepID=A0ABP6ZD17_9ACTN
MDWAGGVSIVPQPTGRLIHTPAEEYFTVRGSGDLVPDSFAAFADDGLVATSLSSGTVGLLGDGLVADELGRILRAADLAVKVVDEPSRDLAVLVATSRWLPDTAWTVLDERCRGIALPWHRCYAEGRRWYLGPFTTGSDAPGYLDTRLRRIAASPWPDELLAYWRWLDGGGTPSSDCLSELAATTAAALLAADLIIWFGGKRPPGRGFQCGYDPLTGELRRHPVLPIPSGLMRDQP